MPVDWLAILVAAQIVAAGATLTGVVRDRASGAPLAGAVVALGDLDRAVRADAEGRYVLTGVPPGPHHLVVARLGYATRTLHALVPPSGTLEIHVALGAEPVPVGEIEVRAPVALRGVESGPPPPFPDRESSIAAVRHHPLLTEPDVFQALEGGEVALAPEMPGGIHVQGGAPDQTAYALDGVPVLNPFHAAGVVSAWNPDALGRVSATAATPVPGSPHALAGTLEGATRAPGSRLRAQGSVSTTQARLTLDGPLGPRGAGHLVSLRTGLHDLVAPGGETSYLSGGTGDWLAKIEAGALGGAVRLLGYGNANELGARATVDDTSATPERNAFEWHSRSIGAEWRRERARTLVRLAAWAASGDASSTWRRDDGPVALGATRRDAGALAALERRTDDASSRIELRFERVRTSYDATPAAAAAPPLRLGARTAIATTTLAHARALGAGVRAEAAATLAAGSGDPRGGGRLELRWGSGEALALTARAGRAHQYAQSLRNPESVVSAVFPVDVFVSAGAPGVPIARGDHAALGLDVRPAAGVRLAAQLYARDTEGVLLVAPRDGGPFATRGFVAGTGRSRGLAAELAVRTARYGVLASYGLQRVRLEHDGGAYVPARGATHRLEGGIVWFATPATSVRLGAVAELGRRATPIRGPFEWESCNLLDQGCEFAGSPTHDGEPLGGAGLPGYARVDFGVRRHWHLEIGGRDAQLAAFAALTNLLGRRNLMTYARDPADGRLRGVAMRPFAPLVAGLDVRF